MRISIAAFPNLASFVDRGITHVISIGDPDLPAPDLSAFYAASYLRAVLRLQFHDLDRTSVIKPGNYGAVDTTYPSEHEMERIVRFAESLTKAEVATGHALIHCFGGKYRSPTAALVVLVTLGWTPEDAWRYILSVHPDASMNLMMVELAEKVLMDRGHAHAADLLKLATGYLEKFDL
jgi:predicted protein tyrosine phosphatase